MEDAEDICGLPEAFWEGEIPYVETKMLKLDHGTIYPENEPGSLMILKHRINTWKPKAVINNDRVSKATIIVRFTSEDRDGSSLEVHAIDPEGHYTLDSREGEEPVPLKNQEGSTEAQIFGSKTANEATWVIHENSEREDGIPTFSQVKILLRRKSNEVFCIHHFYTLVNNSGDDLEDALMNHRIYINPYETRNNIDSRSLTILNDPTPKTRIRYQNPTLPIEAFHVSLWSVLERGRMAVHSPPQGHDRYIEGLEGLMCLRRKALPINRILAMDFPWINKAAKSQKDGEHLQSTVRIDAFDFRYLTYEKSLSLLIRNSQQNVTRESGEVNGLLGNTTLQQIGEFFGLPRQFYVWIRNNTGTCLRLECRENRIGYVIQTPASASPFWSLILVSDADFKRGAAILQTDTDSKISSILVEVENEAKEYQYPMLLPVHLFSYHNGITSNRSKNVSKDVDEVDKELARELEPRDHNDNNLSRQRPNQKIWNSWARLRAVKMPNNNFQNRVDGCDFGQLSYRLHKARMELVDLSQRCDFEKDIFMALKKDIKACNQLTERVNLLGASSASQRSIIDNLQGRIESQTTVLTSLIARRDAILQYSLTKETSRDSKAMKTLALITIVFLPGTFVTTLFGSDGMINFQDGQKGWIYAVVVIPFTLVLMIAWLIWNNTRNLHNLDEEIGIRSITARSSNSKDAKQD
ncbi:hypothetical protein F4805DRAFT_218826 [Annulohypoxylon moriforme]|nr:hypothetical protein F4805DRAFT_218826 [Annulohypoxylon moriforme]